jgi:MATE family multidrug resistance protein
LHSHYRHYFRLSLQISRSRLSLLKELLNIGLPTGVMYCLEVAFFLALTLMVGASAGSEWMAANQVALQYMGTWMAMIFAIAQAITVRMGHLLGAEMFIRFHSMCCIA